MIQIYNPLKGTTTNLGNILPLSVCRERISGVSLIGNKLMLISPFYGEVHPQLGVKKGMYMVVVCWGGLVSLGR